MSKKIRNSETLNTNLEKNTNPEIVQKLENIKGLIDSELFDSFKARIENILEQEPQSKEIVLSEMEKVELSMHALHHHHTKRIRGVIQTITNDEM